MQKLESLYLFKQYNTQKEWEVAHAGKKCPAFNPLLRPKFWEDIAAMAGGEDYIIYPRVIAMTDKSPDCAAMDASKKPYFKKLLLPATEAAIVNIPPDPLPAGQVIRNAWQVPCAELPVGSVLALSESFAQGGVLGVIVKDPNEKPTQAIAFTQYHEDLMEAIARKVGVSEEVIK